MDPIKEAFNKIKEDINSIRDAVFILSKEVNELKIKESNRSNDDSQGSPYPYPLSNKIYIPKDNFKEFYSNYIPSHKDLEKDTKEPNSDNQTHNLRNQTHNMAPEAQKAHIYDISKRNHGVQTDRQTIRQTDRQGEIPLNSSNNLINVNPQDSEIKDINDFEKANEIINSLDSIKSDIRAKFKKLTSQEMTVFSALYTLEDSKNIEEISYKTLSEELNLTQSSIRDYINKLIQKGVPIEKIKQDNKKILLKIDTNLKKIAPLSTIIDLREL